MSLRIILSISISRFVSVFLFWIFVSGYAVFPAMKSKFEEAMRRNDVKAVVLTGKCQSPADWFEHNLVN